MSEEEAPASEINFDDPIDIITEIHWVESCDCYCVPQRVKDRFDKIYYPEKLKCELNRYQQLKLSNEYHNDIRVFKVVEDMISEEEEESIEEEKRGEKHHQKRDYKEELPRLIFYYVPKIMKKYISLDHNSEYETSTLYLNYGAAYKNILKRMALEPDKNNLYKYVEEYEYVERCKVEMQNIFKELRRDRRKETAILGCEEI